MLARQTVLSFLIKEYRLSYLTKALECIRKFPRMRARQRNCVLELYPGKSEKSVFRGMIIPSLRSLGLIGGHDDVIRISANGRLLLERSSTSARFSKRICGALFLELDERDLRFVRMLMETSHESRSARFSRLVSQVKAEGDKRKLERANHWLALLQQAGLTLEDDPLAIAYANVDQAHKDLDYKRKSARKFLRLLLQAYKETDPRRAGIVDIADLRETVAVQFLLAREILTESQFDSILREIPKVTEAYVMSFGSPMGSGNLFDFKGEKFRTLTIRFLRRR